MLERQSGCWCTIMQQCVLCGMMLVSVIATLSGAESGCRLPDQDAGFKDTRMAACRGNWTDHIEYATKLCAPGWEVCHWNEDGTTLREISWRKALSISGCFAFNAAQDGGRCRECRNNMGQDDLAGLGRGCPHKNKGLNSCIRGGRIDASCCVDSHISLNQACKQQPWIDGVMCCKQSAKRPHIIAPPLQRMDVITGRIFMLSCRATGSPRPHVQWYKDGAKVSTGDNRVTMLLSGDLLVTMARRSDSGQYSCEVINEEGIDIAHTQVLVKEHSSGCLDGSVEGLSMYEDIHACAGRWKGHVKHGRTLCKPGWRVCSYHDEDKLKKLSWLDIFDSKGCYAYNAGNSGRGKCRRCRPGRGRMAGLGSQCGRVKYSKSSCLRRGRIDVYKSRHAVEREDSCSYAEGFTTGVLCCKRSKSQQRKKANPSKSKRPHCSLGCENGGQCVGYNVCMCPVGYKGAMCQNAVCPDGCGSRARCVRPGRCECIHPYTGSRCRHKKHRCDSSCLNGGRCRKGKCKCPPTHFGKSCQHLKPHIALTHMNRTER